MNLPAEFKKYFWEVDASQLDFQEKPEYIIFRILEYGDIQAVRWLFRNFKKELIKNVILTHRGFSPRAINFWSSFFNIKKEKILCLKKSYQETQKTHWPY